MGKIHTVQQGEHLVQIAAAHGFSSHRPIWSDPNNADLKALRKNPNVLLPGDRVFIPDEERKTEARLTDARHTFVALGEKLKLRLVLRNESAEPIAGLEWTLQVETEPKKIPTNSAGKLETPIPRDARRGHLLTKDDNVPIDLDVPIGIGELDPVTEVTGWIGRLNNLGYDAGLVRAPADAAAKEQLRSAIEEFQCNEKLAVDGVCGPATQAKLKEVHGC